MDARIEPGMAVVSSDGLAFGRVRRIDADGISIEGGKLVHGEHHVGMGEISGVFAGEVYLRKRAADVAAMPSGLEPPSPT